MVANADFDDQFAGDERRNELKSSRGSAIENRNFTVAGSETAPNTRPGDGACRAGSTCVIFRRRSAALHGALRHPGA